MEKKKLKKYATILMSIMLLICAVPDVRAQAMTQNPGANRLNSKVEGVVKSNQKQNIDYASLSSEARKNIKKLVRQMDFYEVSCIGFQTISKEVKIKLTDEQMARAAALSIPIENLIPLDKGYFGGYETFKLTNGKLRKASKSLFGKALSTSKLRKVTDQSDVTAICDAYRKSDGTAVVYFIDGETETDYAVKKISISQSKKGEYIVRKNIYCGYWGYNKGKVNYRIIYQIKPNKQSKYGYVIKAVRIKPLK